MMGVGSGRQSGVKAIEKEAQGYRAAGIWGTAQRDWGAAGTGIQQTDRGAWKRLRGNESNSGGSCQVEIKELWGPGTTPSGHSLVLHAPELP